MKLLYDRFLFNTHFYFEFTANLFRLWNRRSYKDSLGTFIADLALQILSWLAEEELERIRKRQHERRPRYYSLSVHFHLALQIFFQASIIQDS